MTMENKNRPNEWKIFFILGMLCIAIGVVCNEWILSALFSSDGIVPYANIYRIRLFDLSFLITGLIIMLMPHFKLYRTAKTKKQKAGYLVMMYGLLIMISLIFRNPLVADIDTKDVALSYFFFAMILGSVFLIIGFIIYKFRFSFLYNYTLLLIVLSFFLLSDRMILTIIGLPLWKYDSKIHYVHRPNAIRTYVPRKDFDFKTIEINRYGHHDDHYSVHKPANEFRAIIIGDSVTMGHGVDRSETFSNQLEKMLNEKNVKYENHQIINTGVSGYSTFEEFEMLKRSIKFNPDFIVIGFCMNDILESFVLNKGNGGCEVDYHGVMHIKNNPLNYLLNETGYGRLLQKSRILFSKITKRKAKLQENYSLRYMLTHLQNDHVKKAINTVLKNLENIYTYTKEKNLPVILVIFPYSFQLFDKDLTNFNRILIDHAKLNNIDIIDFTPIWKEKLNNEHIVDFLKENSFLNDSIELLFRKRLDKYFLDDDHYTVDGHRIIAEKLFDYFLKNYISLL